MEKKVDTTIITAQDQVVTYQNQFHNYNHLEHLKIYYPNIKIEEYIPFWLCRKGNCIIDTDSTYYFGSISLPQELTKFQKKWFLEKEDYFQYLWELSKLEQNIEIENGVKYQQVLHRVKEKTYKKDVN